MKKIIFINFIILLVIQNLSFGGKFEILQKNNLLKDIPFSNLDNSLNAVVEITSGSIEKWSINKNGNILQREFKEGKPRTIDYIGYPGNYGFFPQTYLDINEGGDGDAVDVLIIGKRLKKGSVVRVKILGMLRVKDDGLIDNKVIAVLEDSKFSKNIRSLNKFEENYPGVLQIIETWFTNYKGQKMEIEGFVEKNIANQFLTRSHQSFLENEK